MTLKEYEGSGVLELALKHLAGRGPRELVDEDHVARRLVAREVLLDVVLDVLRAEGAVLDDHGLQALAELVVVDAEDGDVGHALVRVQQLLDLTREDVLTARHDHVVVAAVDEEAALGVEMADVSGREQAVDLVLVAAARVALELDV